MKEEAKKFYNNWHLSPNDPEYRNTYATIIKFAVDFANYMINNAENLPVPEGLAEEKKMIIKANEKTAHVISRIFEERMFYFCGMEKVYNGMSMPCWTDDLNEANIYLSYHQALLHQKSIEGNFGTKTEIEEAQINIKI